MWDSIVYNSREDLTRGCEQGGLLENLKVHHNIAYNNSKYGFNIGGFGAGPRNNIEIYNNVSYKNTTGGMYAYNRDYTNISIKSNILSKNTGFQLRVLGPLTEFDISHNIIDGFMVYMDEIYGDNLVVSDPQFVNSVIMPYDFHLPPTSPAINAGIDVGLRFDFANISISQGCGPDIGVYESTITASAMPAWRTSPTRWPGLSNMRLLPVYLKHQPISPGKAV